ncbi:MAG TPA: response regulator [Bacteroidales bacterium]|nr:response regulator [Bacteroidales bacterium]HRZ20080.1 response regulator [Bacteroidales bacterium]
MKLNAMPISAMITEDDPLSRSMLCDLLEDHYPDVHIVGMAQTVKESEEFLKDHKIDLLFLDIELPDGKGFDILQSLQNVDFTVIITTSFVDYIEEIDSLNILYTIVKPLTRESLDKAMIQFSEKSGVSNPGQTPGN